MIDLLKFDWNPYGKVQKIIEIEFIDFFRVWSKVCTVDLEETPK